MRVVITGGAGFLGRQLALTLLKRGYLIGPDGMETEIKKLVVFDLTTSPPPLPADPRLERVNGDITEAQVIRALLTADTSVVFHLAAVVSAAAEADFDLGMRVNLAATQELLTTCRRLIMPPRFIFASSAAVFGGDLPPVVEDNTALTPQTSYGTQKAIGELLINDYSRKNFIDGRALRLPTIIVRAGKPNKAASTFASSIIREPLQGQSAICPVSPETRMWILSPRRAIESFIHAAEIPAAAWGSSRAVALPGLSVSMQELVDSLEDIAGAAVVERILWQPDSFIQKLVDGWPAYLAPKRAEALGFKADDSIKAIIQAFIEDELDGSFVG
jgi:nucleoside-diphosphate-sugar epimerase